LDILIEYLIDDPTFLARVNTVPTDVIYTNDNLSKIFRLTSVANNNMAGYISGTDTFKTEAAALKTFSNAPVQNTGYSCFSNGNYASLRDSNGAIVG
jgi:hypothetical protein